MPRAKTEELEAKELEENLTFAVPQKEKKAEGPMVRIFLPKLDDPGDEGIKVDQFEHVSIANEQKEDITYVLRGEWVEVPVNVFIALKEKYPKL